MYVCLCHGVTEGHIAQAVEQGATRLKDLRRHLRVATHCGQCATCARDCLKNSISNHQQTGQNSITASPQLHLPAFN